MNVTIFHNPDCGTSRNTLAMIRGAGIAPEVILYLETPPDRVRLLELIERAGLSARDAVRIKDTPYFELGLDNPDLTEAELVEAMLADPILINRPFVETPHGVRLCRPSEVLLDILPEALGIPFAKEDGEVVIDNEGRRV